MEQTRQYALLKAVWEENRELFHHTIRTEADDLVGLPLPVIRHILWDCDAYDVFASWPPGTPEVVAYQECVGEYGNADDEGLLWGDIWAYELIKLNDPKYNVIIQECLRVNLEGI